MSRTSVIPRSEIEPRLREQARRGLTPEQAAADLGVSLSQFRRYLEGIGGRILTLRTFTIPVSSEEIIETIDDRTAAAAR